MLQHLYRPSAMPASWHRTNTILGSASEWFGDANRENAVSPAVQYHALQRAGEGGRTVLHSANAPHGARDEHADGHHAEYLDAAAAHVEHDGVHRQRLGRRVGQFPRLGHLERRRIRRRGRSRGRGFLGRLSAHRGRVDIPRRVGHVRRFRPAHSSPVRHAGAGGRGQGAEGRGQRRERLTWIQRTPRSTAA